MQPSVDRPPAEHRSSLRRWGPLAAIAVVALVVVAAVVVSGGKDSTKKPVADAPAAATGAVSYSQAQQQKAKVTFPKSCDTKTGRVAIPFFYAPECYADVADNKGATSSGVTKDSIKVVVYQAPEKDPIIDFVTGAIKNDDTPAQGEQTTRDLVKMFESLYQTYGRKVDLQIFHATGTSTDEVAARADATTVAAMKPFAVFGGPVLTTAWTDEIAAAHIVCLGCVGGATYAWFEQHAPYVIPLAPNGEQTTEVLSQYVIKKVAGHPASHAGDPVLQAKPRRFGTLWLDSGTADAKNAAAAFDKRLRDAGVDLAVSVPYTLDPARLQEQADSAMAKLKSAGVTTVIFSGDPVAPTTFTQQATTQEYFPEWVIGNTVLADITLFARKFDQRQWSHAFGISYLAARVDPTADVNADLYHWYFGHDAPANDSVGVIIPNPALFFAALQTAGPNLTPQTFRDGLFNLKPFPPSVIAAGITYGNKGLWPKTDYNGIDDATEIWWDPRATGPDELKRQGTGMYQYVDGGKRYLAGRWTAGETKAFDPAGAVALYPKVPPSEHVPSYPPHSKGG